MESTDKKQFLEINFERIKNSLGSEHSVFSLTLIPEHLAPKGLAFMKKQNLFGSKTDWRQKIKDFIKLGTSMADLFITTYNKEEEDVDYYRLGVIQFNYGPVLKGQIEFFQEVTQGILVKEFSLTTYYFTHQQIKYTCIEIGADWENGIELSVVTMRDFERNPDGFISERKPAKNTHPA